MNDLLNKLKDGGLVVPYRCPSCGASITVDSHSKPEGLRFCSYCGSPVNTDVLVRLLEAALK
jgi:ribosomal protein S27AE